MSDEGADSRISANIGWTAGGRVVSESLRVGGHLFLTRLLPPEAFGLFLLVNTFVQGLATFSDFGVNASIVQNRSGAQRAFLDTAWTLQIARGVILWMLCAAAAPFVADFYGQPELLVLVPVGAASLVIAGFTSPTLPLLQRRLDLRRWVAIDIAVQVATVMTVVVLAWLTQSVWALIAGPLVTSITRLLISHGIDPAYRPKLAWRGDAARALIGFGIWILINTPLGWLADYADRLTIGRLAPIDIVGVFHIAAMIGGLPYRLLVAVGANAVFPMFSRAKLDGADLGNVYRQVERPVLIIGGLAVCGLLSVGSPAIELVLDERWHGAASMLVPIAAAQWFRIAAVPPANALFALGYPQYLVVGNSVKLLGYLVFVTASLTVAADDGSMVIAALWGFAMGEALAPIFYRLVLQRRMAATGWLELRVAVLLVTSCAVALFAAAWLQQENVGALGRMVCGFSVVAIFWGAPSFRGIRSVLTLMRESRRIKSSA